MSTENSKPDKDDPRRMSGGFRIPSFLMVPVGFAVGWMVAQWPGAVFGGILGVFLWKSRR